MADETSTITGPSDHGPTSTSMVVRAQVVHSDDKNAIGRVLVLYREHEIGRVGHVEGPLALDDAAVSRRHARLRVGPNGVVLTDARSHNGTFVNGHRISELIVRAGDLVRVGGTLFMIQVVDPRVVLPRALDDLGMIGMSPALQVVRTLIAEIAQRSDPVLILGETGTGKELVAQALHRASGRRPFIAVNCGALPEHLVEAELFGHEAGAFTGAQKAKVGLFEAARGGTLFLDELGELPLSLQPKLLRTLSMGEIRPVGANVPRKVDARLIAATHRDLLALVESETFRGDLYARLSRWVIRIPPLREHREDVLVLARHFLDREGMTQTLDSQAAELLTLHPWPFNIRELENVITVAGARATGKSVITGSDLEGLLRTSALDTGPGESPRRNPQLVADLGRGERPTKPELLSALRDAGGNVARVAAYYGRARRQVYRWMTYYDIEVDAVRGRE